MAPRANRPHEMNRELVDYRSALVRQEELVRMRRRGEVEDLLWLLEHPPTLTWGSAGGRDHVLEDTVALAARGVALCPTTRGGDVTCHEPGQLVGYPIVYMGGTEEDRDLHLYLRRLEDGLIRLLSDLGLEGQRVEGRTGVWLTGHPPRKIAAMGIRCAGWVTSHGFALNVANDLEGFRSIIPCGIADASVTSLERELGPSRVPAWERLEAEIHRHLERVLGRPLRLVTGKEAWRLGEPGADR